MDTIDIISGLEDLMKKLYFINNVFRVQNNVTGNYLRHTFWQLLL